MARWSHIIFVVAIIVVAIATLRTFGIAQGSVISVALVVAVAVPLVVAHRLRWWSPLCTMVLQAVSLIVMASAVYYLWYHTLGHGATLEMPWLSSDDGVYYRWALHHYDGRCPEPRTTFFGFPLAMLALWRLLGVSIVWPVAMNVMLTLFTVVMAGSIAVTIASHRRTIAPSNAAALTMALLLLHGYFLSQGFVVQKEALVYVAITMVALVLVRFSLNQITSRCAICNMAIYTIALIILALVRAKYVNFVAIGLVLLALSRWRECWRSITVMTVITVLAWLMGMYCSKTYTVAQQVGNIVGGEYIALSLGADSGIQAQYLEQLGGYFSLPVWLKVLLLPITCGTQFIVPLFWGAESASWMSVMPRISLGWYLSGGLALCYFAVLAWRRKWSLPLVAWWPVVCFAAIAYISAGTISRYILPFQPTIAAIAVYTIGVLKQGTHRRALVVTASIYLTSLTIALLIAYLLT